MPAPAPWRFAAPVPNPHRRALPAGRRGIAAAACAGLLLTGAFVVAAGARGSAPPAPPLAATTSLSPDRLTTPHPGAAATPSLPRSAPVALNIPAIGVSTRGIVRLGRAPDGSLDVPADPHRAGWYALGPTPGELGAAVIVAHVDTRSGPALFWRLGDLRPGDLVRIARRDDTVATFTVDRVTRYPKNRFPTALIYDATPNPQLRLVTCGGPFDHRTGRYRDNTVIFARLTAARR